MYTARDGYVAGARLVIGREEIDLDVVPPPDVAVEIDVSSQSDRKFAIYAALRVPEVWQFKGGKLRFFELRKQRYAETRVSRSFPMLTSDVASEFLKASETEGQSAALKSFRRWARKAASEKE